MQQNSWKIGENVFYHLSHNFEKYIVLSDENSQSDSVNKDFFFKYVIRSAVEYQMTEGVVMKKCEWLVFMLL